MSVKVLDAPVSQTLATVATIGTGSSDSVSLDIKNDGANPLTALQVIGEVLTGGNPFLLASVAGDFSTPVYPVIRTLGAPVTLAAGAATCILINTAMFSTITLKAQCGAGLTTKLDINAKTR